MAEDETAVALSREWLLRRLVSVLVVIAVVWPLRTADTVFLPLAFAIFLIALFLPLQRRLVKHMPRGAAMLVTLLASWRWRPGSAGRPVMRHSRAVRGRIPCRRLLLLGLLEVFFCAARWTWRRSWIATLLADVDMAAGPEGGRAA